MTNTENHNNNSHKFLSVSTENFRLFEYVAALAETDSFVWHWPHEQSIYLSVYCLCPASFGFESRTSPRPNAVRNSTQTNNGLTQQNPSHEGKPQSNNPGPSGIKVKEKRIKSTLVSAATFHFWFFVFSHRIEPGLRDVVVVVGWFWLCIVCLTLSKTVRIELFAICFYFCLSFRISQNQAFFFSGFVLEILGEKRLEKARGCVRPASTVRKAV